MSTISPAIPPLAVANKKIVADIAELVQTVTRSMSAGTVGELTITLLDPGLFTFGSALATADTPLTVGGGKYVITDREVASAAGTVTIRARSTLARKMRANVVTRHETKVSPGDWIKRRAKSHKGSAVVGPASKRGVISQSKRQSELDVLNGICTDPDWIWAEYGNVIYAGTAWYWHTGFRGHGLATWPVTWGTDPASDATDITGGLTPDDTTQRGRVEVTLPYDTGVRIAPLHRLQISGRGILDGIWLVTDSEATLDGVSDVRITAILPRRAHPKKGSS